MKEIARVVSQLVPSSRFAEATTSALDIRGWVATQAYRISTEVAGDNFTLEAQNWANVERALGLEAERFFVGVVESAHGVCRDTRLPKSYAWQIVRAYYSAFYSAHALLRMFGYSCSHLPSGHLSKVYEVATLFQMNSRTQKIDTGYFYGVFDSINGKVRFQRVTDSHADTWSSFLKLIAFLKRELYQTTSLATHRIKTSDFLNTLESCLTHRGNNRGNWLSVVRNDVNYKFECSAWFPYQNRETSPDLAERRAVNWGDGKLTLTYSRSIPTLTLFFETCFAMNSLCHAVFTLVAVRSTPLQNYVRTGSFNLMNQLQMLAE
jgi:uncharacterized protein (UPF0332 family)